MKKRYFFRMCVTDFYKWCRLIPRCQFIVKNYKYVSPEIRKSNKINYEESELIINQYKVLSASLKADQLVLLNNYYITHKVPPMDKQFHLSEIYNNWLEVIFPNGETRLKKLDRKKVGEFIKKTRIESGYNKEEVAGLIGITPATLRAYEEGKVLVPLDILFLLKQIFEISFEKILK